MLPLQESATVSGGMLRHAEGLPTIRAVNAPGYNDHRLDRDSEQKKRARPHLDISLLLEETQCFLLCATLATRTSCLTAARFPA